MYLGTVFKYAWQNFFFLFVVFCGGKTQIRLKIQYHIGVSHTHHVLHNTSEFIRAQRGQIGTIRVLSIHSGDHASTSGMLDGDVAKHRKTG